MKFESLNTITTQMRLLNDRLDCLLSNVRLIACACKPLSDEIINDTDSRELTDGETVRLGLCGTLRGLYESGMRLQEGYVDELFALEEFIADTMKRDNNR